mmetsp:Transcript_96270/g.310842  ORF Transcript_96270/g.310842 Transcript_96270/m.310842 type:complete len:138 (+) Transcript_96270:499-912(+)
MLRLDKSEGMSKPGRNHSEEFSSHGLAAKVTMATLAYEDALLSVSLTNSACAAKGWWNFESSGTLLYLDCGGRLAKMCSVIHHVGSSVSSQSNMIVGRDCPSKATGEPRLLHGDSKADGAVRHLRLLREALAPRCLL